MKKLRYRPHPFDDAEQAGEPLYVFRSRMSRKEYLALGGEYGPPKRKPSKAQRAAKRRWLAQFPAAAPTPRPDEQDPKWRGRKAKVLAVGRCAWCGATKRLTVDHIVPLNAGGSNALKNLQCLCKPCNLAKGSQTGIFPCPG
jgi:5-methylcytosine-specific restriction endonuclease McrA